MAGILDLAQQMVGTQEGQAALNDYLTTGGQNLDPVQTAWCAAFVNATLEQAGYGGTGSNLAKSFLDYGQGVEPGQIQPGDIGIWNRGDPNSIYGHVGVVQRYDPETGQVYLVSGNSGRGANAVTLSPYKASEALAFRRAGGTSQENAYAQRAAANYTPEQRRAAIAAIESLGTDDPYRALGVWTGDPEQGRDRAYGKYQIMGKNIPVWSQQVLGRSMTPEEFLRDDKAQDAIFDKIFGDYVAKYGEKGAAEAWFGGPGAVGKGDRKDALGTTVEGYGTRYMKGLDADWKASGGPAAVAAAGTGGQGGAGTPLASTPVTDPAKATEDGFKPGDAFTELGKALGSGGGAGASSIPLAQMAKPRSTPVVGAPNSIIDPSNLMAQRQKLAEAMTRLNAGKLWV